MHYLRDKRNYVVKLSPGEQVVASLMDLARGERLAGAELRGIGAVNQARIGFFQPLERRYDTRDLHENLEVVSLLGSLAYGDQGPVVHAHVTLGRADFSLVGGHLFEATVSVTLEVFVTPTSKRLERVLDQRFDLNLLKLG
jgi:predicted DNA-binding protein with PD1-like motif